MIQRISNTFRSNPILTRHLATTFTGPRLAIAFLMVTSLMVLLYGTLFLELSYSGVPDGVIYFSHNAVLLGVLVVLLPIKVSGVIEGPRLNRSFDQIVATGVSPARLMIGAWASGLIYAAVLLFVTMPFAACLVLFGKTDISLMLQGYGILFLYSNVIIAVTLAASLFGREWVTTPVVISAIGFVGLMSCVPDRDVLSGFPALVAEWTPLRLFVEQAEIVDREFQMIAAARRPLLLFWRVPTWVALSVSWSTICLVAWLLFCIGPGHRFTHGFDNFGAVVLKGDGKRGFLGKLRGAMTRRVEVGFLYENTAAWGHRWGGFIRYLLVALVVALAAMLTVGAIWNYPFLRLRGAFYRDGYAILTMIGSFSWVGFWALLSSNSRSSVLAPVSLGRFSISSEMLYTILFVGLLGVAYFCSVTPLAELNSRAAAGMQVWRSNVSVTPQQLVSYGLDWRNMSGALCLLLANLFLVARLVSRWSDKFIRVRVLTVLLWVALLVISGVFLALLHNQEFSPSLEPFMILARLSPGYFAPDILREVSPLQRHEEYVQAHLILGAVLLVLLGLRFLPFRRRGVTQVVTMVGVLLASTAGLSAQDPESQDPESKNPSKNNSPVVIESATRGFGGVVFSGAVDFFVVRVRNSGGGTVNGTCWIQLGEERHGEQEFVLSPESTRTLRLRRSNVAEGSFASRRSIGAPAQVFFTVDGEIFSTDVLDRSVAETSNRVSRQIRNGNGNARAPEQHLFVGKVGRLPNLWMQLTFGDSPLNAASCEPLGLSRRVQDYEGLEMLWLTLESLSELDEAQQMAILRYVRMGGTVGFMGGMSPTALAGGGPWQQVIEPTDRWRTTVDGIQLKHVRFPEGKDTMTRTVGGESVTLMHRRHLGAGSIAHVPFLLGQSRVPRSLSTDPKFWAEWDQALRRGGFLYGTTGLLTRGFRPDYTWLIALGGYYVFYALLISVGLFFLARRREQRRRVWWIVLVLPVLFLALVPVLVGMADEAPSVASKVAIRFFHADSTAGYYSGYCEIASSGKRRHRIQISGDQPAVWFEPGRRHYRYSGTLSWADQLPLRRSDQKWEGGFDVTPWGPGRVLLADSDSLDEPVRGKAFWDQQLFVEAEVPPALRDSDVYVVVIQPGTMICEPASMDDEGRVRWEQKNPSRGRRFNRGSRNLLQVHQAIGIQIPWTPKSVWAGRGFDRAFLALVPKNLEATRSRIECDDLDLIQTTSKRQLNYETRQGMRRRIREVEGRLLETVDYEVTLVELERAKR